MPIVSDKYRGTMEYALVKSELIRAARYRGVATYQQLALMLGWPLSGNLLGSRIGHLLGEISEDECNSGRPMLSAVAVSSKHKPSDGFFELAKSLRRLSGRTPQAEADFWQSELQECYRTWQPVLPKAPGTNA
jgi:hypothetical protein